MIASTRATTLPLTSSVALARPRLRHDALEHVQRAGQSLRGVDHGPQILGLDGLPRLLAHAAGLLDGVLPEIRAADDLGHLREQTFDLVQQLLGLLAVLLELL